MDDLNAAPSSTEQAAAEITPQTEAISAAVPEVAAAPAGETSAASAAAEPNAISDTTTAAPVESATTQVAAEAPNAVADTQPAGDATPVAGDAGEPSSLPASGDGSAGEDPNAAASVAVESSAESSPSATNALSGAGESLIAANTPADVPLHVSIAQHLEAIYQLAKSHVDAPAQTMSEATSDVKSHIGDILHKIQNGIAVQSGEMVQKLEALFHKL